MEGLIHRGLLHTWTSTEKWLLLGEEELPSPPDGYVVLFAHFHERGFTTPAHKFLRRLLHYYKIKFSPLGLGLQLQHIELRLGPSMVFCRHQRDPLNEEIIIATTPTMNYSPSKSSASFFARLDAFSFSSWS